MGGFSVWSKSFISSGVVKSNISVEQVDNLKKHGGAVITFLIMHFIYFPFITSCLLINYMIENSFFNYDIISENFFAVSITTTVLMVMLGVLSLIMWGWVGYKILIWRGKADSEMGAHVSLLIMNGVFILLIILQRFVNPNKSVLLAGALLSLALIIFYSLYFTSNFKIRLIMISCLSGISAFIIFVYGDYSSAFFGKALNIFGLGGGRIVNINYEEKSYERHSGKLLLLTSDFVYYIEGERTIIAPIHSVKNLDMPTKRKSSR